MTVSSTEPFSRTKHPTAAAGFAIFGATVLFMLGTLQVFQGLAAIFEDTFSVVGKNYIYTFDATAWGWWHLIIGIIAAAVGIFIFTGQTWARAAGIAIAVISAITQFLWLPHYPIWAIVIIALDIAVIWGLSVYNPDRVA
jgi:hypothetical protein